jgi:hypothetical protein
VSQALLAGACVSGVLETPLGIGAFTQIARLSMAPINLTQRTRFL